jgi:hypothetical protein
MWKHASLNFHCTISHAGNAEGKIDEYDIRTEQHCKDLLVQAKALPNKSAQNEFCKDNSFHPIESGLWGFCEGDTVIGSSSWAFASDSMHNEDLGVFKYIVEHMRVSRKVFDQNVLHDIIPR